MTERMPVPDPNPAPDDLSESTDSIWIDWVLERLEAHPRQAIVGPAGCGASEAVRAVAERTPSVLVRLIGAEGEPDILRALGAALELPVCGDFSAIVRALRPETLLVLDEGDVPEIDAVLDALAGAGGPQRALLAGRQAPPSFEPNELPPRAPKPVGERDAAVAWLPAGLPGEGDRVRLPRGVAEALRPELSAARAAERLAPALAPLLALAQGAPWPALCPFADALALRFLAREHPDPALASDAAAAAARVLAAAGQLPAARELLTEARGRCEGHDVSLNWAEGDVLLAYGILVDATDHHRAAARAGGPAVLNASATLLAERGLVNEARRRFKQARSLANQRGDPQVAAEALRGLADVAVSAGEALSADALYEEAGDVLAATPLGQAKLDIGLAGVAIARGESSSAERHLESARRLAGDLPLVQAAIDRRRAELRLRQGRHDEAGALVRGVIWALQRLGHRAAAAGAIRLSGDVAAASRRPREAVERYEQALQESARIGDLSGARRTLVHLLEVERIGGDVARVDELLALLGEIDTELGDPALEDGVRLG